MTFPASGRSACEARGKSRDYVYMDSSDLVIDLVLNMLLEYSGHVPVLHVVEHGWIGGDVVTCAVDRSVFCGV